MALAKRAKSPAPKPKKQSPGKKVRAKSEVEKLIDAASASNQSMSFIATINAVDHGQSTSVLNDAAKYAMAEHVAIVQSIGFIEEIWAVIVFRRVSAVMAERVDLRVMQPPSG